MTLQVPFGLKMGLMAETLLYIITMKTSRIEFSFSQKLKASTDSVAPSLHQEFSIK